MGVHLQDPFFVEVLSFFQFAEMSEGAARHVVCFDVV
jgi:hypothetical protein